MMLALFVYLIGFFSDLKTLMSLTFLFMGAATVIGLVGATSQFEDSRNAAVNFAKKTFKLLCVSAVALVIVPTEKTMWMMAAGYATQSVYESEAGDRVRRIINLKLDQYVEELAKETVKSSTK